MQQERDPIRQIAATLGIRLIGEIDQLALELDRSRSDVMRDLLRRGLRNYREEQQIVERARSERG